jgi:hypothetical protein
MVRCEEQRKSRPEAYACPQGYQDVTAKNRHPLEEGDPCLFNHLKRMDFAPLPDMARLRGNDTQALSRLFAVQSSKTGEGLDFLQ